MDSSSVSFKSISSYGFKIQIHPVIHHTDTSSYGVIYMTQLSLNLY